MRIVFYDVTVTNSIGGVQTAIWELAHELATRDVEIHVYGGHGTIRPPKLHHSVQVFTFPFIYRDKVPDLGNRFQRIIERLSMTLYARRPLAEGNYDLVVLTKPFDFFVPYFTKTGPNTLYAFLSEGTSFFRGDKYLSKHIHYWFSCSHFNGWQIMSRYKRYPKVIYNGVDTDVFRPFDPDMDLMHSLKIKREDIVLIFAGRLVGWKGVKNIIKALNHKEIRNLPVVLLIIGNGPEKERLEAQAVKSGLMDNIRFLDFVPNSELPRYYSIADIGIYPSIADEAFGISIAEAMACGKPVIASYIGGIPEVVGTEGSCGFLTAPLQHEEIAEKIIFLAKHPEIKLAMGERARQRITGNFTWKKSADRFLSEITT